MVVCARLNKSRASFYKRTKQEQTNFMQDQVMHEMVLEKRKRMPRLGGRKLYVLLKSTMDIHQIQMGRDKFFVWLKRHDLLVEPKRSYTKTTNSYHRFRIHQNLIKETEVTKPNQVWVSDITYLRLQKGFCYLALITDAFSRKIVGYDVSDTLELSGCLRALNQAIGKKIRPELTHHSDRGIQYCSHKYIETLEKHKIRISMAEAGNCYENAMAERVNGILKNEFNLDRIFANVEEARKATNQAIQTYNFERPHMALKMKKPTELYAA